MEKTCKGMYQCLLVNMNSLSACRISVITSRRSFNMNQSQINLSLFLGHVVWSQTEYLISCSSPRTVSSPKRCRSSVERLLLAARMEAILPETVHHKIGSTIAWIVSAIPSKIAKTLPLAHVSGSKGAKIQFLFAISFRWAPWYLQQMGYGVFMLDVILPISIHISLQKSPSLSSILFL